MKSQQNWAVDVSPKATGQLERLKIEHSKVYDAAFVLLKEIALNGPVRSNRPNFSKLKGKRIPDDAYHCHIKKGKPTYVVCW